MLRYRRAIGAEAVAVLADVKKKHSSHAVTADVDIVETARAAVLRRRRRRRHRGGHRPGDGSEELATVRGAVGVPCPGWFGRDGGQSDRYLRTPTDSSSGRTSRWTAAGTGRWTPTGFTASWTARALRERGA